MSYDPSDSDDAYDRRMFSDSAMAWRKADCRRQADMEARRDDAEKAAEAAFLASNPWPTDPTALFGHRMGLQEWIRERGD
jgi:hypothetical protein